MGRANRDKRGKFVTSAKGGKRVSSRVQNVLPLCYLDGQVPERKTNINKSVLAERNHLWLLTILHNLESR